MGLTLPKTPKTPSNRTNAQLSNFWHPKYCIKIQYTHYGSLFHILATVEAIHFIENEQELELIVSNS